MRGGTGDNGACLPFSTPTPPPNAGKFQTPRSTPTPPPTNCGYCGAKRHGDGSRKAIVPSVANLPTSPRSAGTKPNVAAMMEDTKDAIKGAVEYGFYAMSTCLSTTPSSVSPSAPR